MLRTWRCRAVALILAMVCLAVLAAAVVWAGEPAPRAGRSHDLAAPEADAIPGEYVVLAWNDLGMHCYNRSFQDVAVLPPFNNLFAQVVRVGDPPLVITTGITVTYFFTDNTYSVGKSNFWSYDEPLFGLDLPPDVGLAGKGLAGEMDPSGNGFVAEGIPLTEFRDSAPDAAYPYQVATVVVYDQATGRELARTTPVAPVSTEMHCDHCHYDGGPGNEGIATGVVEQNLLTKHDEEQIGDYPPGHEGPLMGRRPILCAECHSSNALGAPGAGDLPSLSRAMHDKHSEAVPDSLDGCYNCHPGPQTRCLRDVMSARGMDCIDCHGGMAQVAANPEPWLNEPRCDDVACHGSGFAQDKGLYRQSKEHGGLFCEACHDSTHAVAPSIEANDAKKFVGWQGQAGPLATCIVCHSSWPAGSGPHGGAVPPRPAFIWTPSYWRSSEPGGEAVYVHGLHNRGNGADRYGLSLSSSQGWAAAVGLVIGGPAFTLPAEVYLEPGQSAVVTVTVTVPAGGVVSGLTDTTVVTAASTVDPTKVWRLTDQTHVPPARRRVYLPVVMKRR